MTIYNEGFPRWSLHLSVCPNPIFIKLEIVFINPKIIGNTRFDTFLNEKNLHVVGKKKDTFPCWPTDNQIKVNQ